MSDPIRVLVIDDSEVVLEAVRQTLDDAGMEVRTRNVAYGSSWEIVRLKPDVVLVDVNMPGLGGSDIVSVTKGRGDLSQTRVLLFSAQPPRVLETLALECGADGWIHKTSDLAGLVDTVRRWARSKATGTPGRRASVVFVDPEPETVSRYRELFGSRLTAIEFVASGTEALQRLQRKPRPDLVVCELSLPRLSGPQLYQQLVEADRDWARRFLFVTGADARERWVSSFVSSLRFRVLFKPLDPDGVRREVGRRLDLVGA